MSTPRTAWPVRGRPVGRSLVHTGLAACWYPAVLLAGTTLLNDQPSDRQRQWVAWLSTDLHNLSTHPVGSMIGSALVCQGDLAAWMLLALVGLAGLGARIGAWAATSP